MYGLAFYAISTATKTKIAADCAQDRKAPQNKYRAEPAMARGRRLQGPGRFPSGIRNTSPRPECSHVTRKPYHPDRVICRVSSDRPWRGASVFPVAAARRPPTSNQHPSTATSTPPPRYPIHHQPPRIPPSSIDTPGSSPTVKNARFRLRKLHP